MAQKLTEELYFDDGTRRIHTHPSVKNGCVVEAGRSYSFELWRKPTFFGDVKVDQFWLQQNSIYGCRGKEPRNYEVLVEHYRAQCMRAGTILDDEVLGSYILAKLLPYTRRNGSRRVFDDAVLTSPRRGGESKQRLIEGLNGALAASRRDMLGIQEFHRRTADLLGPPQFEPAVMKVYQELADELLDEGCRAVGRWGTPGLQAPISKLQQWMKTFARRRGNEDKKLALDMLSYECRAAMHRCYSAVWDKLLTHLEGKYALDEASVQFHRLMHFDVVLPSNMPNAYFHAFHGHIFALHPGISLFLQTRIGGELIADYLRTDDQGRPLARLLNGFWIGLNDYYVRSELCAERRKIIGRQADDGDVEAADAAQTRGRGRRRLPGVKHEDDGVQDGDRNRRGRRQRRPR